MESDNPEPRPRFECRNKVINEAVRLHDLMIHVHQDCTVERMSRQPGIVRFTENDRDVVYSAATQALAQSSQIIGHYIFSEDVTARPDDRR